MTTASKTPPTYPEAAPTTTPMTDAAAAETIPTVSETRAPHVTSSITSRPRSSVPSQCALLGGCRMSFDIWNGEFGGREICTTKVMTHSRTMKPPLNQTAGFPHRRVKAGMRACPGSTSGAIAGADAWVDEAINQIRQDIHENNHRAGQQKNALDDRIIAICN